MKISNIFGDHELSRLDYALVRDSDVDLEAFSRQVESAVDQHGFAIIENAVPGVACDHVVSEMRAYILSLIHI